MFSPNIFRIASKSHTFISNHYGMLLKQLTPEQKKVFEEWQKDLSYDLAIEGVSAELINAIEDAETMMQEITQMEKDQAELDKTKDALKMIRTFFKGELG
jgi:deoxyadenosine/deoxycytidine kinase